MNPASLPISGTTPGRPDKPWSRPMWFFAIVLTCAVQFGFIFLLGARHTTRANAPLPAPPLTLLEDKNRALVELTDPTVFVLPSRHGFSGVARGMTPRTQFVVPDWNEPFRWLPLSVDELGKTFQLLLATDLTPPVQIAEKTEPRPISLLTPPAINLAPQSVLRVEGDIANRDLLVSPDLPAWPSADVLKPSEVQVIADASGKVVSATLLRSSELAEADQRALDLAHAARFEAAPGAGLTWGRLTFAWHTVPLPTPDETAVPQPAP